MISRTKTANQTTANCSSYKLLMQYGAAAKKADDNRQITMLPHPLSVLCFLSYTEPNSEADKYGTIM